MHIYIYFAVDFYLNKPWLQRLLTFWLKMFVIIIVGEQKLEPLHWA